MIWDFARLPLLGEGILDNWDADQEGIMWVVGGGFSDGMMSRHEVLVTSTTYPAADRSCSKYLSRINVPSD